MCRCRQPARRAAARCRSRFESLARLAHGRAAADSWCPGQPHAADAIMLSARQNNLRGMLLLMAKSQSSCMLPLSLHLRCSPSHPQPVLACCCALLSGYFCSVLVCAASVVALLGCRSSGLQQHGGAASQTVWLKCRHGVSQAHQQSPPCTCCAKPPPQDVPLPNPCHKTCRCF